MRLLAITPIHVSDAELARRQARYDRLAPASVSVHLEDLGVGPDVPRALETGEDIAASESELVKRFAAVDASGVDAFLPDCVLDPVVDHQSSLPRPVFGIGRLSAHFLAGFGVRLGSVARNRAIAAELDRKMAGYGLETATSTAVLDLSVDDIADDAAWAEAVERTVSHLDCDVVINACSAVEVSGERPGPVLVDPTRLALRMVGLHWSLTGARHDR
jgi:Asp/Glu/hydantoin racemase